MVNNVRDVGVVLEALKRESDNTQVKRSGHSGSRQGEEIQNSDRRISGKGRWNGLRVVQMQCWKVYLLLMTL